MKRKSSFIVIDGGDGSGKATQSELLIKYLKKQKKSVLYLDFPQYYKTFYGQFIGRFLTGEFGDLNSVSPYLISFPYAFDRATVKDKIKRQLKKGGYVVTNRYTPSNMAHQGAKFTDKKKREEYLEWVKELELNVLKLPQEDIVVYLYVPWEIGMALTHKKAVRAYTKGAKTDIAEADIAHRKAAEKMYLELAKRNPHWIKIDCVEKGQILPIETIHQEIINQLQNKRII